MESLLNICGHLLYTPSPWKLMLEKDFLSVKVSKLRDNELGVTRMLKSRSKDELVCP